MPQCYDPLTNRTVTVSGPCPGTTIPMGPGIVTPPPQGTETQAQATPGGNVQQATGSAAASAAQNIPGVQGVEQAAQAAQSAAQAANDAVQSINNFLTGGKSLKELGALWSDPTSWKRLGLLVAGFIALILGFVLWAFGGRNREPTEVITQQ